MTVEDIQKKFPNPVRADSKPVIGQYCVGGALCMTMGGDIHFALSHEIEKLLRLMGVPDNIAANAAIGILIENDAGHFETAWKILGRALEAIPVEDHETVCV